MVLFMAPAPSLAIEQDEILLGSLTQHFFNPESIDSQFANRVSSDGSLIRNPMLGYRQVHTKDGIYDAVAYFGGQNSVGEPMFGVAWSIGSDYRGYRLGVLGGIYMQDSSQFLDKGIVPIMMIPYRGWGPTPVLGLEATKTWDLNDTTYFLINSLLTVPFINVSIGLGWKL